MAVFFHKAPARLKDRQRLKAFLLQFFAERKQPLTRLDVIFCTDEELLAMNRDFLSHDYYTDILTFDLTEPGELLTAELYISVDRITENATEQGVAVANELHRVIFHGCLHLTGLKDDSESAKKGMRNAEDCLLRSYDVPRGTS